MDTGPESFALTHPTEPPRARAERAVPVSERQSAFAINRAPRYPSAPSQRTKLDLLLDTIVPGKSELTIDIEGYTRAQVDRIIATAQERGLHAAASPNSVLIRDLRLARQSQPPPARTPRYASERARTGVASRSNRLVDRVRKAISLAQPLEWSPIDGVVYRSKLKANQSGLMDEWVVSREIVINGRVRQDSLIALAHGETPEEIEKHTMRLASNDWLLNKPFVLSSLYLFERRPKRTPHDDRNLAELAGLSGMLSQRHKYVSNREAIQHELKMLRYRLQDEHYSSDELNSALGPYEQIRPR